MRRIIGGLLLHLKDLLDVCQLPENGKAKRRKGKGKEREKEKKMRRKREKGEKENRTEQKRSIANSQFTSQTVYLAMQS